MVSSHQSFGEFASWHPHWHTIVLEGGFHSRDRFFFMPIGAREALSEIWRRRVVGLFLHKGVLNLDLARTLLSGRHSGFSRESGTCLSEEQVRVALSQYILRAPLSLEKIHWDQEQDTLRWTSAARGYFKGKHRHFSCLDFIARLRLHIPPRGIQLVRRYGLYSSRGRGTGKGRPALRSRAPTGWYGRKTAQAPASTDPAGDQEVCSPSRRRAWARLQSKIDEVDPLCCPVCASTMSVIAVIPDPAEIRKLVACLAKKGRGPPLRE